MPAMKRPQHPYRNDMFSVTVDNYDQSFDPPPLREAYHFIGNRDILTNPFADVSIDKHDDPVTANAFMELADLAVAPKETSALRKAVLSLRDKNNVFLRTINAAIIYNDENEEKLTVQKSNKTRTRRDVTSTHLERLKGEMTPNLNSTNSYTATLTDPEAHHYNGSPPHRTAAAADQAFDYNDDYVLEEQGTLSAEYEDFTDLEEDGQTSNESSREIHSRSDYFYRDDDDEDHDDRRYEDNSAAGLTSQKRYYNGRGEVVVGHDIFDEEPEAVSRPSRSSYKARSAVSQRYDRDHHGEESGEKYKLVPVTVYKKVPIVDEHKGAAEGVHIDNVNIYDTHVVEHHPKHRPRKKYRKKYKWHSQRHRHRNHHHRVPGWKRKPSLRKKFPKIKWLLDHH